MWVVPLCCMYKNKVTTEELSAQLFIKHHSYSSLFRLDTFSYLQTVSIGIRLISGYVVSNTTVYVSMLQQGF